MATRLGSVLASLMVMVAVAAGFAKPLAAETLRFEVMRDGLPFGRHVITIFRDGDRIEVENTAGATVAMGPFVLFRYAYRSREIWEGDQLRRISAWTNDDGKEMSVTAEWDKEGLRMSGPDGQAVLPPSVLPTSFWTMAVAKSPILLDTQTGQLARVTSHPLGTKPGHDGDLLGYRLTGDLNSELWYDSRGLLAKAHFKARGSSFDYVRSLDTPLLSSDAKHSTGGGS